MEDPAGDRSLGGERGKRELDERGKSEAETGAFFYSCRLDFCKILLRGQCGCAHADPADCAVQCGAEWSVALHGRLFSQGRGQGLGETGHQDPRRRRRSRSRPSAARESVARLLHLQAVGAYRGREKAYYENARQAHLYHYERFGPRAY